MTAPSHPEFVDNLDGNTLERALRGRLEHLCATLKGPVTVSIASGYFNPGGFGMVSAALDRTAGVRLLLGAEPLPPAVLPDRKLGEPRGDRYEAKLTQEALEGSLRRLRRDRDHIPFERETLDAIQALLRFLDSGKIEVRRYEKRFLHGKAYLFSDGQGVLAGSSNFTAAGLAANLELNLGHYQPSVVEQVRQWYERLWSDAAPFDLAAIYRERFAEYDPYLIYLRILWERYGAELEAESEESGRIELTRFQTDGVTRAKRILERYNGVLVADSVGLGKSFIAAELFTEVIERNRQRALLVAPAQLRDSTWARFKRRYQAGVEVISFEQLKAALDSDGDGRGLGARPDQYSLIVIDEAHAFRNPDTGRARALRKLLQGDPPKKVVMLTATPVNNSLWDLYDLLAYFLPHDAAFADQGIPSLKRRFEQAAAEDPFTLDPKVLFDILDATTVRRTRHFVQKYYPNDRIKLKDGTELAIRFPEPTVTAKSYDLEEVLPGFFDDFAEILQPEERDPKLTMARYWPSRYRRDQQVEAREVALVGLIRSGLLKRFESSARAFVETLRRMVESHDRFVEGLNRGVILTSEGLAQLSEADSDEAWDEIIELSEQLDPDVYDVPRLKKAVRSDRALLETLRARAAEVTAAEDPKLRLLRDALAKIAAEAEREGLTDQDRRNRRKVLIFSYFADTVDWITDYLRDVLATDRRLAAFRGRMAAVRGTEGWEGVGRQEAVYGFVPESSEAPPGWTEDKYDILVTTDVLAEGMNLQQAARIINYDLPWNPMRLVQRHGRIDRIGSRHDKVFITCIFPDRQLDRLLALEERIRRKLAEAAATIGLDQTVIPGVDATEQVFADEREQIEAVRRGDSTLFRTGGETGHAHSGEEYRQELRKALGVWGDAVRNLPWGVGSGMVRSNHPGWVFCARVFDRVFLRFVAADAAQPIERDSLRCLSQVVCEPEEVRVLPESAWQGALDAWQRARRDIFDEWQALTDPANLQPDVRPLFRAAAEHVRMHPADGMTRDELDRLVEALEAPRGQRIERELRRVFTLETARGVETTRAIAAKVRELGLQPWKAPEPLPVIDLEEVELVVWMGLVEGP